MAAGRGGLAQGARASSLPTFIHSVRSLVSRLQRDGVNMAEERREVRIEERLKIKIGEFHLHYIVAFIKLLVFI